MKVMSSGSKTYTHVLRIICGKLIAKWVIRDNFRENLKKIKKK